MIWKHHLIGTTLHGKTVSLLFYLYNLFFRLSLKSDLFAGCFGQQGMEYKDWLECNIKNPLAMNRRTEKT